MVSTGRENGFCKERMAFPQSDPSKFRMKNEERGEEHCRGREGLAELACQGPGCSSQGGRGSPQLLALLVLMAHV